MARIDIREQSGTAAAVFSDRYIMGGFAPWVDVMRETSHNKVALTCRLRIVQYITETDSVRRIFEKAARTNPLIYSMFCYHLMEKSTSASLNELYRLLRDGRSRLRYLKELFDRNPLQNCLVVPVEFQQLLLQRLFNKIKPMVDPELHDSLFERYRLDLDQKRMSVYRQRIERVLNDNAPQSWQLLMMDALMAKSDDGFMSMECGLSLERLVLSIQDLDANDMLAFFHTISITVIKSYCERNQCASDMIRRDDTLPLVRDRQRRLYLAGLLNDGEMGEQLAVRLQTDPLYFNTVCRIIAGHSRGQLAADSGLNSSTVIAFHRYAIYSSPLHRYKLDRIFSSAQQNAMEAIFLDQYGFDRDLIPLHPFSHADRGVRRAFYGLYALHTVVADPAGVTSENSLLAELIGAGLTPQQLVGILSDKSSYNVFVRLLACAADKYVRVDLQSLSPGSHWAVCLTRCNVSSLGMFVASVANTSEYKIVMTPPKGEYQKYFAQYCRALDQKLTSLTTINIGGGLTLSTHRTYAEIIADRRVMAAASSKKSSQKKRQREKSVCTLPAEKVRDGRESPQLSDYPSISGITLEDWQAISESANPDLLFQIMDASGLARRKQLPRMSASQSALFHRQLDDDDSDRVRAPASPQVDLDAAHQFKF